MLSECLEIIAAATDFMFLVELKSAEPGVCPKS